MSGGGDLDNQMPNMVRNEASLKFQIPESRIHGPAFSPLLFPRANVEIGQVFSSTKSGGGGGGDLDLLKDSAHED